MTASKLTADDVRAIRDRWAAGGITQKALGAEYGVDQTWVSWLVRGITPKHTEIPASCRECARPMVTTKRASHGCVRHGAHGRCVGCDMRRRRGQSGPAVPVRRFAERIPQYTALREQGLKLRQIADRMGMTENALDAAVVRARRTGLLPPAVRHGKPLPQPIEDPAELARLRRDVGLTT